MRECIRICVWELNRFLSLVQSIRRRSPNLGQEERKRPFRVGVPVYNIEDLVWQLGLQSSLDPRELLNAAIVHKLSKHIVFRTLPFNK